MRHIIYKIVLSFIPALMLFLTVFFFANEYEPPFLLILAVLWVVTFLFVLRLESVEAVAMRTLSLTQWFAFLLPVAGLVWFAIAIKLDPPEYPGLAILIFALIMTPLAVIGIGVGLLMFGIRKLYTWRKRKKK